MCVCVLVCECVCGGGGGGGGSWGLLQCIAVQGESVLSIVDGCLMR